MKPVVFLHGFTGSPESWASVLKFLQQDYPERKTVCFPLLGHSPQTLDVQVRTFEDEVDRLATQVKEVSSEPVHLVGYSLGGRVAFGLLSKHPELFHSATLMSVNPGLEEEEARRTRIASDQAWIQCLREEGLETFVDRWEKVPLFQTQQRLPLEILQQQRVHRLEHSAEGLARSLEVLGLGHMPNYWEVLRTMTLPVQVVAGEQDEKFSRLAVQMVERLPSGSLHIAPQAGHNVLLEAPLECAEIMAKNIF